jgi:hypothetical protein
MLGLICGLAAANLQEGGAGWHFRAKAHLSDDETVAKMGSQICCGLDLATRPGGYGLVLFSTRTILHSSFLFCGVLIFALFLSIS